MTKVKWKDDGRASDRYQSQIWLPPCSAIPGRPWLPWLLYCQVTSLHRVEFYRSTRISLQDSNLARLARQWCHNFGPLHWCSTPAAWTFSCLPCLFWDLTVFWKLSNTSAELHHRFMDSIRALWKNKCLGRHAFSKLRPHGKWYMLSALAPFDSKSSCACAKCVRFCALAMSFLVIMPITLHTNPQLHRSWMVWNKLPHSAPHSNQED